MFDIGFLELMMIGIIGLLVMGPEKLPGAIRTGSLWMRKIRRSLDNLRYEIEREAGVDELRREMRYDEVTESIKQAKGALRNNLGQLENESKKIQKNITEELESSVTQTDSKQPTQTKES